MQFHRMVDEVLHLSILRYIGLQHGGLAKSELLSKRMQTLKSTRTKYELRPVSREPARCSLPQTAAGSSDNYDLVFNALGHVVAFLFVPPATAEGAWVTLQASVRRRDQGVADAPEESWRQRCQNRKPR